MTPSDFRRLALSFPEASENAHMNHPDFRVNNRIFATLGYPDKEWAMVRLTPEQQSEFVHDEPGTFVTVKGAWGKQGATNVRLKAAEKDVTQRALEAAWSNAKAPAAVKSRKKRR